MTHSLPTAPSSDDTVGEVAPADDLVPATPDLGWSDDDEWVDVDDDLFDDDDMLTGGDHTATAEVGMLEDDPFADAFDDLPEEEPAKPLIGRVAVVGYPNVGKSTLVNRLAGGRTAIVHDTPGVTRDRKEITCEWNGDRFVLIDTGGVDQGDPRPMARQIVEQAKAAISEADLILFVVDAKLGMSAADLELAEILRSRSEDVFVVANKIDNEVNAADALEFHALGLGEPLPLSAHHGNHTGDLLDRLVEELRERGTAFTDRDTDVIRVCLLGRPNVGKSTLVNAMLGSDRVIVSEVAGTTRDAIDTPLEFEGRQIVLVDTAGLRRGHKERDDVEYYSEVRTLQAADRADVALVLVDASEGVREADLHIADQARQRHCATIVLLSKWDINDVELGDVQDTVARKMRQRPEIITTSGITKRNIAKVLQKVVEVHGRYSHRVPTAEFNKLLTRIKEDMPAPTSKTRGRKRLNVLYGTQYQAAPPRFRVMVNDRGLITRSWAYMVENKVREEFGFQGCPVIIDFHSRDSHGGGSSTGSTARGRGGGNAANVAPTGRRGKPQRRS
jgi:GTP-binding protein